MHEDNAVGGIKFKEKGKKKDEILLPHLKITAE